MIYVTGSCETQKEITKVLKCLETLQSNDFTHCYISPLNAFSHLRGLYMPLKTRTNLRLDLLTDCEKLIVVGEIDGFVQAEIDLANKCKMEVEYRL